MHIVCYIGATVCSLEPCSVSSLGVKGKCSRRVYIPERLGKEGGGESDVR